MQGPGQPGKTQRRIRVKLKTAQAGRLRPPNPPATPAQSIGKGGARDGSSLYSGNGGNRHRCYRSQQPEYEKITRPVKVWVIFN